LQRIKFNSVIQFLKQLKWFVGAKLAILTLLLIKIFAFDLVKVNANDMQPNYYFGDVLLVNKFATTFKHGDCVWFKVPLTDSDAVSVHSMQRLLGLPGDTLFISEKKLFINGILTEDSVPIKKNYILKTKKVELDSAQFLALKILEYQKISDFYDYGLSLEGWQIDSIKRKPWFDKLEEKVEKRYNYDEACYPYSDYFLWNMDNYGPVYIPRKNDSIQLNESTLVLYKTVIEHHEKNKLELRNDSVFINDAYKTFYTFKQNYFFTISDNRDNCVDSRMWGFLPKSCLIGRVIKLVKKAN
jgi:signal peptidase I